MAALKLAGKSSMGLPLSAIVCPTSHYTSTIVLRHCVRCRHNTLLGFRPMPVIKTSWVNRSLARQLSTKSAIEDTTEENGQKSKAKQNTSDSNKPEKQTVILDKKSLQAEAQNVVKSQFSGKNKNFIIGTDERFTVFHGPSRNLININLETGKTDVSLFFKKTDEVVNLSFNKEVFQKEVVEKKEKQELIDMEANDARIQSISEVRWQEVTVDYSKLRANYLKLAKIRLTGLVVITTMGGYAMAPAAFDPLTFLVCSVGTGLMSAAANSINHYLEVPFDSQMNRTKNRPLVRGALSPLHAVTFAAVTGTTGITMLAVGVNPLTAGLGLLNLVLYTSAYTPMKRMSIANTWVGSIVGAIPPMMGWAACTGALEPGAWLLGGILFAWQFPHFNALSWNLRPDYSRAGYRMMSVINPDLCKRTTLRYSLALIGLCSMAPLLDVTTWWFTFDSLPINAYMVYLAYQFYKKGDSNSSRKLFRYSLFHIPALMILMYLSKKRPVNKDDKRPPYRHFSVSKLKATVGPPS